MKEFELFSESVELGGRSVFGLGDLCCRRGSVSGLTCATMEVMMKTIQCFFFLDEGCETPKEGPFFVSFRFSRRYQC